MSTSTHVHDCLMELPDRIAQKEIRDLCIVNNKKAITAICIEWLTIAAAIILCQKYWHPGFYVLTVMIIGARQHALLVILHDASHYILLTNRKWNDWVGNILLGWPNFVPVQGFRFFHSEHHRHLNTELDGNRELWDTHNEFGELKNLWRFPRTWAGMAAVLFQRLLTGTGVLWIFRGILAMLVPSARKRIGYPFAQAASQLIFYLTLSFIFTYTDTWKEVLLYWIVPYCTWHTFIQYIRIICEHSAIKCAEEPYHMTRTTIPHFIERIFILPRNIGYHHEHHWHPAVPFYNLPELHQRLAQKTNFGVLGNVTNSVFQSLRECVTT